MENDLVDIELGIIPETDGPPTFSGHNPPELPETPKDTDKWAAIVAVPEKFEELIFSQPIESRINKWLRFPFFTISVTIVDVALMIWVLAIGGFTSPSENPLLGPSADVLIDAGAKVSVLILEGEWWRLISAMFLHVGILHLLMNLLIQVPLGIILEHRYDTIRFALVYLFSGIAGNVASAIFVPQFATVGASGCIFGVIAMWTVMLFQDYHELHYPLLAIFSTLFTILVSFGLGLLPLTDNYAHLGGFVVGLFLSIAIFPKLTKIPKWKFSGRIILSIVALLLFLATFIGLFVVLYLAPPASEWCPTCQYFNCIDDGSGWCNYAATKRIIKL